MASPYIIGASPYSNAPPTEEEMQRRLKTGAPSSAVTDALTGLFGFGAVANKFAPAVNAIYPGNPAMPQTTAPVQREAPTDNAPNLVEQLKAYHSWAAPQLARSMPGPDANILAMTLGMQHIAPGAAQAQNLSWQERKAVLGAIDKTQTDESLTPEEKAATRGFIEAQARGDEEGKKKFAAAQELAAKQVEHRNNILLAGIEKGELNPKTRKVIGGTVNPSKLLEAMGSNDFVAKDPRTQEMILEELGSRVGQAGLYGHGLERAIVEKMIEAQQSLPGDKGKPYESGGVTISPITMPFSGSRALIGPKAIGHIVEIPGLGYKATVSNPAFSVGGRGSIIPDTPGSESYQKHTKQLAGATNMLAALMRQKLKQAGQSRF